MQAITVRCLPATNHRARRFKAISASGLSVIVPSSVEYTGESAYPDEDRAAAALARKLGWAPVRFIRGSTKDGLVYVIDAGRAHDVLEVTA